jgi:TonB-dependent receptor
VNFPYFDITKLSALKGAPGVIVHDQFANDIAGTFRVVENTAALYSQLNLESGPLSGNIGLRYVITDERVNGATGTSLADATEQHVHNSYHFLLPAANFRYAITPKLIGRLAYSETFARQQFNDLAISSAIDLSTETNGVVNISRGNPNLKPYTSKAADVGMEWYPNRATAISIAGYIKFVDNFLIPSVENTTVTLPDGTTAPAIITSVVNDPKTTNLRGVEISMRRDLTFLPGPLRNLGIAVNWNRNWTNIRQTAISLVGATAPTTPDLTSRNVVNAQLYYSTRRLDLRLAYRYFDRYERAFFNSYQVQPGGQLDFSGGWTIHGNLRLIGSVTNLTHARMRRYIPDSRDLANTTLTQLSVYQGRVFSLGFRATL